MAQILDLLPLHFRSFGGGIQAAALQVDLRNDALLDRGIFQALSVQPFHVPLERGQVFERGFQTGLGAGHV